MHWMRSYKLNNSSKQSSDALVIQLLGTSSALRQGTASISGTSGKVLSLHPHELMICLWRHIFWQDMTLYLVELSPNGFDVVQFPCGAPILLILRGLMPKEAENPGGTSNPSVKGNGIVPGGWMTTLTPSLAETELRDSCNPGRTRISVLRSRIPLPE